MSVDTAEGWVESGSTSQLGDARGDGATSLVVEGVTLYGEDGTCILRDIRFAAAAASVTLLIGPTGSGKSSLLDVMGGLRAPSQGRVTVDGVAMWRGNKPEVAALRRIGMGFQFPEQQLFARTVRAEFAYSLRPLRLTKAQVEARMLAALADVGLSADLLEMPPLLLSGGQRRRVALATTLAADPAWLLLDEPTAGLDPEGVRLVRDIVRRRRDAGAGVVIATHDWDTFAPLADQVVWLERGQVRFAGPLDAWLRRLVSEGEGGDALGEPTGVSVWRMLHARGITLPLIPLDPTTLPAAVLQTGRNVGEAWSDTSAPASGTTPEGAEKTAAGARDQHTMAGTVQRGLATLDPRAKWGGYFLLCAGMVIQYRWLGLAAATVTAGAFVWAAGVPWARLWRVSKGLLVFMAAMALLAGVRLSLGTAHPVGFTAAAAVDAARRLYPVWLLVTCGLALPATTSTMMLKRGLEAGLAPLRRLRIPVDAFSLAAALVLRFIPVIMQELTRFTRIARARGKSPSNRLRPRNLPALVLPLLLSVLELGDTLAVAMEARGYARIGQRRTQAIVLRWTRQDSLAVGAALAMFAVLLALRVWAPV
ncbi:MAG: ATP-binding cassette domain-containing protein [Thermoflavifilum sp.]|nr:ATP-binding cassette domain-containing protein [Thermoflavifilum sp.]MCL6515220.1 ATP-binding cassette domain-containing protein [Alicyclobacillus sp.]